MNVATTTMFAFTELSPPENLNIPPIQIPTESDEAALAVHNVASANPRLVPLLGTPPPQRRQTSFGFPSLAATASASASTSASASASASATASIESAASILLSMAGASPHERPSKCRRVVTSFIDYCRVCEISLLNVAHGIYADVCQSCESIQHRFRNGISFPACMICSTDAYHIHRNCNQAICKRCVRQHTLCPSCKVRIDKQ